MQIWSAEIKMIHYSTVSGMNPNFSRLSGNMEAKYQELFMPTRSFEPGTTKPSAEQLRVLFVDLPGFEPGLFGSKIRRVTSYTIGQSIKKWCKGKKKWNKYDLDKNH